MYFDPEQTAKVRNACRAVLDANDDRSEFNAIIRVAELVPEFRPYGRT